MANLLQSSATKTTAVPQFYSCYLNTLATKGQATQAGTQFVGAQPLQQAAFCEAATNFAQQQPTFQQGISTLGCAANKNIAGAAQPFLEAGTSASPLCAAKPLICQSANLNLGCVAQSYMSPYINSAVNQMSDIAQRNIQQNLDPMATAATVGSGQFGSQRGAQVLGQVNANAEQCLNSAIANMLNTGYGQALNAAGTKQGALSTLAGTTAQAQQAQNAENLTAGQTAATAQAECSRAKTAAGLGLGTLGSQAAAQNLSCINALATLGAQCQTIKQNAYCYPLSTLTKLSGLMQGQQIPTTVTSTMCMSPLSAAGTTAAGLLGLFCSSNGKSIACNIGTTISGLGSKLGNLFGGSTNNYSSNVNNVASALNISPAEAIAKGYVDSSGYATSDSGLLSGFAQGGIIKSPQKSFGCASLRHRGGLPSRSK